MSITLLLLLFWILYALSTIWYSHSLLFFLLTLAILAIVIVIIVLSFLLMFLTVSPIFMKVAPRMILFRTRCRFFIWSHVKVAWLLWRWSIALVVGHHLLWWQLCKIISFFGLIALLEMWLMLLFVWCFEKTTPLTATDCHRRIDTFFLIVIIITFIKVALFAIFLCFTARSFWLASFHLVAVFVVALLVEATSDTWSLVQATFVRLVSTDYDHIWDKRRLACILTFDELTASHV